jgi:hypothetical protein
MRVTIGILCSLSFLLMGCPAKSPVHNVKSFGLRGLSGIHLDGLKVTETKILADGTKVITEKPVFTKIPIRNADGNVVMGKDGKPVMIEIPMDVQFDQNVPIVIAGNGGSLLHTLIAAGLSLHSVEAMKDIGSAALGRNPMLDGTFEGSVISK